MKMIVWFGFVLAAHSAAGAIVLAKPGQRATIACGFKYVNDLKWHREMKLIVHESKSSAPFKGSSHIAGRASVRQADLEISGVKEEDAGTFTCQADWNSAVEHTLVVYSVSASPSADLQLGSEVTLQVKGLNPESVSWTGPDGSSHAGLQMVKSVALSDAGTWTCMFSHNGATYEEQLDIKVQIPAPTTPEPAPSQKSGDGPNDAQPGVTSSPSDAYVLLGLSWWIWVAIGAGCMVVVLLVVCVICMCKRLKRQKRKLRKLKNVRHPLTPKKFCECNCPTAAAKPQQGRRREKPSPPPLQPFLMH